MRKTTSVNNSNKDDPTTEALTNERKSQTEKNVEAIRLLRSWRLGDEQEQRETLEYLKDVLNADRLSDRKLFL